MKTTINVHLRFSKQNVYTAFFSNKNQQAETHYTNWRTSTFFSVDEKNVSSLDSF